DRKLGSELDDAAGAVVDLFLAFLDAERVLADGADRVDDAVRQGAAETARDVGSAIGEHADVEIVAHAVRLRAAGDKRIERLVEHVGDEIRLRAPGLGYLVHRSRLIDDEQEAGRIVAADFGLIRHGGGLHPVNGRQRSAATAGRVPMSKKSAMASMPAL